VRGDLAAGWSAGPRLGPQQVPRGNGLPARPAGHPRAPGSLSPPGGGAQQQPHRWPASAGGTISRLRILPVAVFGSASTIHTLRGYLYAATCALTWSRNSSAVTLAPGLSTAAAPTSSPSSGWGRPITAASATAGCSYRTSSISRG